MSYFLKTLHSVAFYLLAHLIAVFTIFLTDISLNSYIRCLLFNFNLGLHVLRAHLFRSFLTLSAGFLSFKSAVLLFHFFNLGHNLLLNYLLLLYLIFKLTDVFIFLFKNLVFQNLSKLLNYFVLIFMFTR